MFWWFLYLRNGDYTGFATLYWCVPPKVRGRKAEGQTENSIWMTSPNFAKAEQGLQVGVRRC